MGRRAQRAVCQLVLHVAETMHEILGPSQPFFLGIPTRMRVSVAALAEIGRGKGGKRGRDERVTRRRNVFLAQNSKREK